MDRKDQILDISLALFLEKGYDKTSITDILERSGIARGTLYYHFESKEAIMDAIIERASRKILEGAEAIPTNASMSADEKLIALLTGLNMDQLSEGELMIDYLNRPQNALFHEKSNRHLIRTVAPLLAEILRQGKEEGIFDNPFPEETAEQILLMAMGVREDESDSPEREAVRLHALVSNVERISGAAPDLLWNRIASR